MNLLSTKEAAIKLGVSVRRIRQLIDESRLPAQKVGRDYAIEEKSLKDVQIYGKPGRPRKSDTAIKQTKKIR